MPNGLRPLLSSAPWLFAVQLLWGPLGDLEHDVCTGGSLSACFAALVNPLVFTVKAGVDVLGRVSARVPFLD